MGLGNSPLKCIHIIKKKSQRYYWKCWSPSPAVGFFNSAYLYVWRDTYFCMWCTLLPYWILSVSTQFSFASLVFSMCIIISPRNNNTFTSFLSVFIHLVPWFYLIVLTRTSGTILNRHILILLVTLWFPTYNLFFF